MVRKFKKKVEVQPQKRRWAKGQSSTSNPDLSKHREKVKSKFLNFRQRVPTKTFASLTLDSVKMHDGAASDVKRSAGDLMEEGSDDGCTIGTALSGLSDCTNMTFGKIQQFWRKGSAKHKEVCAILAAITEVIRQEGAAESDTAYFAALVTALESFDGLDSVAAIVYLLSMLCKKVPDGVLRAKFDGVSSLLLKSLAKYEKQSPALSRSTLICLSALLRSLTPEEWSHSSTMNVFQTMLSHCFYTKPKIRKVAQNSVCAILKASSFMEKEPHPDFHPAAVITAKYCQQVIEKSGAITDSNASVTCHAITLLGETFHCFPTNWLKTSCEAVLKLMMLSLPVIKLVSFQALQAMFKNRPEEAKLSIELCGKILTALYDYQPSPSDVQMMRPWLALMKEGVKHLVHVFSSSERKVNHQDLVLAHMIAILKACYKIMESSLRNCAEMAASTVVVVLQNMNTCKELGTAQVYWGAVNKAFSCLGEGLQFKYHSVRDLTLTALESAFVLLTSPESRDTICGIVSSMVNLRDTLSPRDTIAHDKALAAAVTSLGPKPILESVPIFIDGADSPNDFHRSWMLPLLKSCIKNTEIAFFTSYFLPLAAKFRIKALQLRAARNTSSAGVHDTLQYQIWSLLPNFCDGAKDICTSFPVLARTLGTAITDRPDIRAVAMHALRCLISSSKEDEDRNVVQRFAKNYLPILFNLYTTPPSGKDIKKSDVDWSKSKSPDRLAALETIRAYLVLAEPQSVRSYFSKALTRVFNSPEETDATRLAVLDLVVCMVPHVDLDLLSSVYQDIKPMLRSPNPRMQKKAYRLLDEVLQSTSSACHSLVNDRLDEITTILIASLAAASPSSKGCRLKCIESVLKLLSSDEKYSSDVFVDFLRDSLPEVILCTRDKRKVRGAAFSILVTAGNAYCQVALRISEDDEAEVTKTALKEYFEICSVGLGGSVIAITASICALSRIVYEFNDTISSELLSDCIHKVCILLGTNTRQVCKAALGFVTVLFSILSKATLAQHLDKIIGALFEWKSETRRHFRFRVKKMLERLVRKFGYETIYSMVPEDHKKQLSNLKKTRERQKRQQRERGQAESEEESDIDLKKSNGIDDLLTDSDSDDEDSVKEKKPRLSYRLEDRKDDPVNLLDNSSSRNVVATSAQKTSKRHHRNHPFIEAEDGRMIIEDMEKPSEGDSNNSVSAEPRKKKDVNDDVEEMDDDTDRSYAHGGVGIHRNINSNKVEKKEKRPKKTTPTHEPYAYIPLKKSVLNRRKQKKLQGEFEGMVRAAKSGRSKGKKSMGRLKHK